MHTGTLYIVATPIGNLQDTTLRAIDIFKNVVYIACEDTRKTSTLLRSIGIRPYPMLISFNEFTEERKMGNILNLLRNGQNVALVSDSGTPLVSDPGFPLVRQAIRNSIKVESIPGPSAVISALVTSGLPTDKFTFVGFLPKKAGNRKKLITSLKKSNELMSTTVVIFIPPHGVIKILAEMEEILGNIFIVVCRELTKKFEEVRRENIQESIAHFSKVSPKGEFVVLFNLKSSEI